MDLRDLQRQFEQQVLYVCCHSLTTLPHIAREVSKWSMCMTFIFWEWVGEQDIVCNGNVTQTQSGQILFLFLLFLPSFLPSFLLSFPPSLLFSSFSSFLPPLPSFLFTSYFPLHILKQLIHFFIHLSFLERKHDDA